MSDNKENKLPEEEVTNKKKKKKGIAKILDNFISVVILVVCICGLVYSGKMLYNWILNNINSKAVMNGVNDLAGISGVKEDEDPGAEFGLDFESLVAYNSDIVGWIRIPRTSVSYALVQAEDNTAYLRHSLDRTYNEFGWPFLDYRNAWNFTDKNTVIYGHNITSGLMFADVADIYSGSLGNDVTINIYRRDYRLLTYKVFSVYVCDPEQYYLNTYFTSNDIYSQYLSTIASRTTINFNQSVGIDDTIITLSTCTRDAKRRIVVHAKLISDTEMPR